MQHFTPAQNVVGSILFVSGLANMFLMLPLLILYCSGPFKGRKYIGYLIKTIFIAYCLSALLLMVI